MLRPAGIGSDERQIDLRLHRGRKLDLGALSRVTQTLQCHLIALAAQIEALVFLELVNQPVNQPLINVVAAEVGVAIRGLHLNDAFADFENRNIERTAAKVVHRDGLVLAFVESVGERCRRGLIDNSLHIEPGNLPGIFGRLALRIVEVRRHSDDRLGHLFAEVVFRRLLELLQNHRRDLRRSLLLALRHNRHVVALAHNLIWDHLHFFVHFVIAPSHEALDRINRVFGIGNRLPLGHLPDQPLPGFGERHHRRGSAAAFFVGNDLGLATLHDGHARVGGAEVNSDNLRHKILLKISAVFQR